MRQLYGIQANTNHLKTKLMAAVIIVSVMILGAGSAFAGGNSQSTVYNNIPNPTPGNVPSIGYEATSTSEFGGQLGLDGTQRKNPEVTVLMSSWACKSGSWNNKNCITNPGSTFAHPITLNVYNVNSDDSVGSLIKSKTQTFTMPYRPTADDGTNCKDGSGNPTGAWWDGTTCLNGKAFKISFDLDGVTLPDNVIVGVAYNTSHYGSTPIGTQACNATPQGCPYDALNVGTNSAPSVGTAEPSNDDAYLKSTWNGAYCDTGGPTGTFRLDATCWTGYLPAFKVEAEGKGGKKGGHHGHHNNHGHKGDRDHHKKYNGYRGFYSFWNR